MSPDTIPLILCGALCLLPLLIGVGAFYGLCQLTNRFPSRDVTTWVDNKKRKHVLTELSMQTREERRFRNTPEETE